jgi:hypothetical protein
MTEKNKVERKGKKEAKFPADLRKKQPLRQIKIRLKEKGKKESDSLRT